MTVRMGLSSASVPSLTARELAALTRRSGGNVVDLRTDKGHRWEEEGLVGLGDVEVAFIGVSVVLGRPGQDYGSARRFGEKAVKVFADTGAVGSAITERQLTELRRDREPGRILIETHRGHAAPAELVQLCERHGCRLVIDNMGLAAIADDFSEDLARLAPWAAAIQVKGFSRPDGRAETPAHRPLTAGDLSWLGVFGRRDLDITVESRAGVPGQDLNTLRQAWEDLRCA